MSMFACLLLCFISMLASLDLGFAMLCAPHGLVHVWLHPSLLRFVWMLVCLVYTFSTPCIVDMLALLALRHPFGFLYFFASLHVCLHVHAWVCVLSIFQSNETMDTQSKPTFVPLGHYLLFDNMFVCLFVCFTCLFAPVWHLFLAFL